MKNETARREIESLDYYLQNRTDDYSEESHTAMMMAIKALEQQPCEDCISREQAKQFLYYEIERLHDDGLYDCFSKIIDDMYNELSSVTPRMNLAETSQDCISRQAVLDAINFEDEWLFDAKSHNADTKIAFSSLESRVKALPPVTPERPKGKWIDFNWNDGDICRWGIKCSECHTEYKHGGEMWHNPKFCPNCGAEMGGAND